MVVGAPVSPVPVCYETASRFGQVTLACYGPNRERARHVSLPSRADRGREDNDRGQRQRGCPVQSRGHVSGPDGAVELAQDSMPSTIKFLGSVPPCSVRSAGC